MSVILALTCFAASMSVGGNWALNVIGYIALSWAIFWDTPDGRR